MQLDGNKALSPNAEETLRCKRTLIIYNIHSNFNRLLSIF